MTERARGFLEDAQRFLQQARDAHQIGQNHIAIERSAKCIEHSLKAILLLVGGTYPQREHDVSRAFEGRLEVFPDYFRSKVPRFALLSRIATLLMGFAEYGYEAFMTPPSELFSFREAETWMESATEILSDCQRLYWENTQT